MYALHVDHPADRDRREQSYASVGRAPGHAVGVAHEAALRHDRNRCDNSRNLARPPMPMRATWASLHPGAPFAFAGELFSRTSVLEPCRRDHGRPLPWR